MMAESNRNRVLAKMDWLHRKISEIDEENNTRQMDTVLQHWVPVLYRVSLVCHKLQEKGDSKISEACGKLLHQIKSLDLRFNLQIEKSGQASRARSPSPSRPKQTTLSFQTSKMNVSMTLADPRDLPAGFDGFKETFHCLSLDCARDKGPYLVDAGLGKKILLVHKSML